MNSETKYLGDSELHRRETHARWIDKHNRSSHNPEYKSEWGVQQCGGCRYYVPLSGVFVGDWGSCTNAFSNFDKQVMYEHDGCEAFAPASDGWYAGHYFEDQRLDVDGEGNLIDPKTGEKVDLASLE